MSAPTLFAKQRTIACSALLFTLTFIQTDEARAQSTPLLAPEITSLSFSGVSLVTQTTIPPGYRHAVLEIYRTEPAPYWEPLIAAPLTGASATLTFTTPNPGARAMVRVKTGDDTTLPASTLSGSDYYKVVYGDGGTYIDSSAEPLQTLNRIGYGASTASYSKIQTVGTAAYIEEQLAPETIDESGNTALNDAVDELFLDFIPGTGDLLLERGDAISYFKGQSEPPVTWKESGFIGGAGWLSGISGIGYDSNGNDTYNTELPDMRRNIPGEANYSSSRPDSAGYSTVYVRHDFEVANTTLIENLLMQLVFDDAFVAYLNGTEVARFNTDRIAEDPPLHTAEAAGSGGFEDDSPSIFDITANKSLLVNGTNTLAIQLINTSLSGSSDAALIASLTNINSIPYTAISSIKNLQQLIHLRGVYSEKQLQATLAAFWENHFTTDYDKIQDYIEELDEFEALPDNGLAQSRIEAATIEYEEYEFLYQNALGNFGDLLLYSATSPSMLIYLDGIRNRKAAPNENYAREILELNAFGVDNRYTQADIEELARCFTGWSVRKVLPILRKPFPQSAREPFLTGSIAVANETPLINLGEDWSYLKGTAEPLASWKDPEFDSSLWDIGPSGFGYDRNGDNPQATDLNDMEDNYVSFYIRKEFTVDPSGYDSIALSVDYDDGYVAYLNGVEINRSASIGGTPGTPPAFDSTSGNHGAIADGGQAHVTDLVNLLPAPAVNVLAIQCHNGSIGSSDAALRPTLLGRISTTDSINPADPNGVWTFWFNPDQHDLDAKVIFPGTAYEMPIAALDPANAADGIDDAIDVIDSMIGHPSTAEFVCVKLVNKFVSDEISLDTYQARTAPGWLLAIMDDAITAWNATAPAGNIKTVMTSILDPQDKVSGFWLEGAHLSKIKDPVEFINSSFRALDATIISGNLPDRAESMGMLMFERDDPDGFSELGIAWADTLGLLERLKLAQGLAGNANFSRGNWDIDAFTTPLITLPNTFAMPEDLIDHLDQVVFNGKLGTVRRSVMLEFANSDDAGSPSPFENLNANQRSNRLRDLTGLILAAPEFQFQ